MRPPVRCHTIPVTHSSGDIQTGSTTRRSPVPRRSIVSLPRTAARLPRMIPDLAHLPPGRIVTLADGVTTKVHDTGEEHLAPAILLHGMAATGMLNWYQTFERLRGEYRLITFDQRWHGKGFHGDFRFDTLAEDVLRVADH